MNKTICSCMIEPFSIFCRRIHCYSTKLVLAPSAFRTASLFTTGNIYQNSNFCIIMAPDCHFRRCVCENPQCLDVQTALCNYDQNQSHGCGEGTSSDVWCQHPIQVNFDWATASFKSWLFILSLCHHLTAFKKRFLSTNERRTSEPLENDSKNA